MTTLLRWIRGLIGVIAVSQALSLVPVLSWVQSPQNVHVALMWLAFFKLILALSLVALYGYLRGVINRRGPSTVLLKSMWTL